MAQQPSFGVFFTGKSPAISSASFTQVDASHWVLDARVVAPSVDELREVALFLTSTAGWPPDAALALYVSLGEGWSFRGHVSADRPSEVVPLLWPEPEGVLPPGALAPTVGVSLEPLAEARGKEQAAHTAHENFAKAVGLDVFNFLRSFPPPPGLAGDYVLVPGSALDGWYRKLSDRLRRDPDFFRRARAVT